MKQQKMFLKSRKNKKALRAALPALVVLELKKWKLKRDRNIPLVFHFNGQLIRRQQISKAYNRVMEHLRINYVTGTHMLRKTSGTLARKITGDVYAASKLLGHSSVSITEKYYQEELDEDKVMVAKALNGVLEHSVGDGNDDGGGFSPTMGRAPVPQRPPRAVRPILNLVKSIS
jgi:integrase